jgi:hypothetical protein
VGTFAVVADVGLVTDDGVAGLLPEAVAGPAAMVVDIFAPTAAELAPTTNVLISIDGSNK